MTYCSFSDIHRNLFQANMLFREFSMTEGSTLCSNHEHILDNLIDVPSRQILMTFDDLKQCYHHLLEKGDETFDDNYNSSNNDFNNNNNIINENMSDDQTDNLNNLNNDNNNFGNNENVKISKDNNDNDIDVGLINRMVKRNLKKKNSMKRRNKVFPWDEVAQPPSIALLSIIVMNYKVDVDCFTLMNLRICEGFIISPSFSANSDHRLISIILIIKLFLLFSLLLIK